MAPSEARPAAVRRLGGIAQIQEECRDVRHTSYIESFFRDLQYAVRMLVKAPAFTLTATATLALGIGANTAIFQLLDAIRLRTLPVPEAHRLAQIEIPNMNFGILESADNLSYPLYQEIRTNQQAFSDIFAWDSGYTSLRLGRGAETRQVSVLAVSGTFATTLEISPAAGRLFRPEDDFRGCTAPGVVLSYPSGKENSAEVSRRSARVWSCRIVPGSGGDAARIRRTRSRIAFRPRGTAMFSFGPQRRRCFVL